MSYQKEIKHQIAFRINECLKGGKIPWFHKRGIPKNPLTEQRYTGINAIFLDTLAHERKLYSCYWATYAQWQKLGFSVKKKPENFQGDYGAKILRYKTKLKGEDLGANIKLTKYQVMETFSVFSFMQCDAELTLYESYLKERKFITKDSRWDIQGSVDVHLATGVYAITCALSKNM